MAIQERAKTTVSTKVKILAGAIFFLLWVGVISLHVTSIAHAEVIQPVLVAVGLFIASALAFVLASSLQVAQPLIKISGVVLFVSALTAGVGHWLPQVEGGYPSAQDYTPLLDIYSMSDQQRADVGETIIFGGIGKSKEIGSIGKGQCPLCHMFRQGWGSERAPNLWGITARKRLHATSLDYIVESHVCPSCYVVGGFGVKGSDNRESPMPKIHKPPISLTIDELVAVDTWLFFQEGEIPPSPETIAEAYKKLIPPTQRLRSKKTGRERQPFKLLLNGEEAIETIFAKSGCLHCHTIPGIFPRKSITHGAHHLTIKTRFNELLKDPLYGGQVSSVHTYVREAILDSSRHRVPRYPNHQMPENFSNTITALALDKMVDYLAEL